MPNIVNLVQVPCKAFDNVTTEDTPNSAYLARHPNPGGFTWSTPVDTSRPTTGQTWPRGRN